MLHRLTVAALFAAAAATVGCQSRPSRAEALQAIRDARPGVDTATVYATVWQDGPPWFSCAEVIAKFASSRDSAAVRDQVGNWKPLVMTGWLVIRDTAHGNVTEPGWCVAKLGNEAARLAQGWTVTRGAPFPAGEARRGWTVPVGRRRLAVIASPKALGPDSASVEYLATLAANANGAALGANRDTTRSIARLRRVDGRWRAVDVAREARGAPAR
jgi:hypothetical protein